MARRVGTAWRRTASTGVTAMLPMTRPREYAAVPGGDPFFTPCGRSATESPQRRRACTLPFASGPASGHRAIHDFGLFDALPHLPATRSAPQHASATPRAQLKQAVAGAADRTRRPPFMRVGTARGFPPAIGAACAARGP